MVQETLSISHAADEGVLAFVFELVFVPMGLCELTAEKY